MYLKKNKNTMPGMLRIQTNLYFEKIYAIVIHSYQLQRRGKQNLINDVRSFLITNGIKSQVQVYLTSNLILLIHLFFYSFYLLYLFLYICISYTG